MRRWRPHVLIAIVVASAVVASILFFWTSPFARAVELTTVAFSLSTLVVVVLTHVSTSLDQREMHRAMFVEQQAMRLGQTRPQVLAHFAKVAGEDGRERIVLVVKHFGGGPALDVRFAFTPPLVNRNGNAIGDEPPLSTGIAVFGPGDSRTVDFDDFLRYQNIAGLGEWAIPMGLPVDPVPLGFETRITLRDPLGDDRQYTTTYTLSLRDLMSYTMQGMVAAEATPQNAPRAGNDPAAAS